MDEKPAVPMASRTAMSVAVQMAAKMALSMAFRLVYNSVETMEMPAAVC